MSPSPRKRKRGKQLVPCSFSSQRELEPCSFSSQRAKEKKYVYVFYLSSYYRLVRVSIDSLIPSETPLNTPCEVERQTFSAEDSNNLGFGMTCICTFDGGKKSLYCFGGRRVLDYNKRDFVVREARCYDLSKHPEVGKLSRCRNMIRKTFHPLAVQVGHDCIYVLGKKTPLDNCCSNIFHFVNDDDDDGRLDYNFQEYNFKKDKWTVLGDDNGLIDISKCDCQDKYLRDNLEFVPHVVIGNKIHVSLGNSSFTFDTVKHTWEDCKLFENFWSARKDSGLTPLNFYGKSVWNVTKKVMKNKYGGPPFGFSGRGVLWDENILLGVHYAKNCPVVAFLLDENGNAVKSQPLSLNNLGNHWAMADGCLRHGARVLYLGGDGYFCLVHLVAQEPYVFHSLYNPPIRSVELVTFKVSRSRPESGSSSQAYDYEHFLECEVVRKDLVADDCPKDVASSFYAFSG